MTGKCPFKQKYPTQFTTISYLFLNRTFYSHVKKYAADEKKFFADFAAAFQKLEELGVPFKPETPTFEFKRS
jgi:catalase (peroxidase I)